MESAFERLSSYYLGGGLDEVELEFDCIPYRLYRDGATTRLEPQFEVPASRGPMTDEVSLKLAEDIEEHLRSRGVS